MTIPVRALRLTPKSALELDKLTGSSGEIFLDKATLSLRIFDGKDRGGMQLLKADLSNLETTGGSEVDFGAKIIIAQEFRGDFTGQVSDIRLISLPDNIMANKVDLPTELEKYTADWEPMTVFSADPDNPNIEITSESVKNRPEYTLMKNKIANAIAPDSNPRAQVSVLADNGTRHRYNRSQHQKHHYQQGHR